MELHKELIILSEALNKLHKVASTYSILSEYAEQESRNGVDSHYSIIAAQKIIKDYDLVYLMKLFSEYKNEGELRNEHI